MANYSKTVSAGARLYYIDARTDKRGAEYLSITEMDMRTKTRHCIFVHEEHLDAIIAALAGARKSITEKIS